MLGQVNAIVGKIPVLWSSLRIHKGAEDVEILCAVFAGDLFEKAVDILYYVIADPFKIHRQQALDHNGRLFVPRGQVADDLAIRGDDVVLSGCDVVDAGHEEDEVRFVDLSVDVLPAGEQTFDRFAGDAEIGHPIPGEPMLPVTPLGE